MRAMSVGAVEPTTLFPIVVSMYGSLPQKRQQNFLRGGIDVRRRFDTETSSELLARKHRSGSFGGHFSQRRLRLPRVTSIRSLRTPQRPIAKQSGGHFSQRRLWSARVTRMLGLKTAKTSIGWRPEGIYCT